MAGARFIRHCCFDWLLYIRSSQTNTTDYRVSFQEYRPVFYCSDHDGGLWHSNRCFLVSRRKHPSTVSCTVDVNRPGLLPGASPFPLVPSYTPRQCYVPTGEYTDGRIAIAADKTQSFPTCSIAHPPPQLACVHPNKISYRALTTPCDQRALPTEASGTQWYTYKLHHPSRALPRSCRAIAACSLRRIS